MTSVSATYRVTPAEWSGLQGLSLLAQVLYLREFRARCDFDTGMYGGIQRQLKKNYQALLEVSEFVPDHGSTSRPWKPSKEQARAAVRELIRAGLIVDSGGNRVHGLIYRLPLVVTNQSAQNMNPTGTPQEPHTGSNTGNNTQEPCNDNGSSGMSHAESPTGTPLSEKGMSPKHQGSGIQVSKNNHHTGSKQYEPERTERLLTMVNDEGANVTVEHPIIQDWLNRSVSIEVLGLAIRRSRDYQPPPATIGIEYLNKVVNSILSISRNESVNRNASTGPEEKRAWYEHEAGIRWKANVLGITESGYRDFEAFKAAVFEQCDDPSLTMYLNSLAMVEKAKQEHVQ